MAKKDLDSLFKEKLGQMERPTRPEAWQKISSTLAAQDHSRRKAGGWLLWSIAASVPLWLSLGFWWLTSYRLSPATSVAKLLPKQEETIAPQDDATQERQSPRAMNQPERKKKELPKKEVNSLNQEEKYKNQSALQNQSLVEIRPRQVQPSLPGPDPKIPLEFPLPGVLPEENKKEDAYRIVVTVKLSPVGQTPILAQNEDNKPKKREGKIWKTLKNLKEGLYPDSTHTDEEGRKLWASIGKK
ncbi:MAG: hypothetical protein HC913_20140 [Microscillaceae bacterium]|nr:hypothetical protein [Microscillaceae bacterium]